MNKTLLAAFALFTLILVTACKDDSSKTAGSAASYDYAVSKKLTAKRVNSAPSGASSSEGVTKKIAQTHSLEVETSKDDLQKRQAEDAQKCEALACEILNSSVSENYANLNARIAPEKLDEFLKFNSREGAKIAGHTISSDDKTLEYIDVSARLKNKEQLKERLLSLLKNTTSSDVKALLEIEKELSRVQEELDSATSQMQYLSKITDMVTLSINYNLKYNSPDIEYGSIKNSFKSAWQAFIRNIAEVIEFVGAVIPWIPIIFIGAWLINKAWRKRKKS